MRMNQYETIGKRNAESGKRLSRVATVDSSSGEQRKAAVGCMATRLSGFTLTELLVVITIIAILAGLITGAAMNALRKAKETAISIEIKQLATAMEDFKNQYGSYPPNVYKESEINNQENMRNRANVLTFLKRVAPRSSEFNTASNANNADNNISTIGTNGLSPAEALVFWLSGFSADVQRPLTGTDLVATNISVDGSTVNNVITIDSFQAPLYDFDRGRLRYSVDGNGDRRFLRVQRINPNTNSTEDYEIQLYEYLAEGSQEPIVYFDTSRETPLQTVRNWNSTEFFYTSRNPSAGNVYPLKQLRPDAPEVDELRYIEYVQKKKFQILHCGIDDFWGDSSLATGAGVELDVSQSNPTETTPSNIQLLYPTGPFLNDFADNLGNFGTSNFADAQEE